MKKYKNIILISLMFLYGTQNIFGQATSSGPASTNLPSGAGDYLGWDAIVGRTLDIKNNGNYPIDFYSNSTFRATILADGKFGIGTNAPSYKLDVKDDNNCSFRVQSITAGSANSILSRSGTGYNCAVNYKTGATDVWLTGVFSDDNYRIRNTGGTTNFIIDQAVGAVGIGSVSPLGKLYVSNDVNTTVLAPGLYTNSTASTAGYNAIGVQSLAAASGAGGNTYAIDAQASGSGNLNTSLKLFTTSNATYNYGIYSQMGKGIGYYSTVTGTSGSTTEQNSGITVEVANGNHVVGVSGNAANGVTSNYGGKFDAIGGTYTAPTNVGVQGLATGAFCTGCVNRGVHGYSQHYPTANPGTFYGVSGYVDMEQANDYAGYFVGKVYSTVSFTVSDSNLKSNVISLNSALAIIDQLLPKTYDFKTNTYAEMNLPQGNHAGLIAQQVEQVLPQVVGSAFQPDLLDKLGNVIRPAFHYKVLNYTELIPYLIAAIKEQQLQIQALQMAQNPVSPTPTFQKEIKLTDKATLILDQNIPNPFKENTTINYNIPDDVKQAQLLFYNSKGNVINTVDISERGAGSLLVYGSDLSSGVYTYTLLADGKVVKTQRMVKIK